MKSLKDSWRFVFLIVLLLLVISCQATPKATPEEYKKGLLEAMVMYDGAEKKLLDLRGVMIERDLTQQEEKQLLDALETVKRSAEKIHELTPPDVCTPVHNEMIVAAHHLYLFAILFKQGWQEGNVYKIEIAGDEGLLAQEAIERATEALKITCK